jgi:hypothetical protein
MTCKTSTLIPILIIGILIILLCYCYLRNEGFFSIENIQSIKDLDAIIYINLENREDRKKQILDELKKLEIPENKIYKVSGIYIPNNGHKGCIQSHILALNMAKLNGWNNVLILEDDAELTGSINQFNTQFQNMLKYLKQLNSQPAFDVLMLATANSDKKPVELLNGEGADIVRIIASTTASAYIVKNHYIDKIITLFTYLNAMMEARAWSEGQHEKFALDQNWQEMQKRDKWFGWKNDLIRQRNSHSTTNEYLE